MEVSFSSQVLSRTFSGLESSLGLIMRTKSRSCRFRSQPHRWWLSWFLSQSHTDYL